MISYSVWYHTVCDIIQCVISYTSAVKLSKKKVNISMWYIIYHSPIYDTAIHQKPIYHNSYFIYHTIPFTKIGDQTTFYLVVRLIAKFLIVFVYDIWYIIYYNYPHNVTITLQMPWLPSKSHDYPPNVRISLQVSQLPSTCHDYPQNVTITLKMSQLPSKYHNYP